MLLFFFSPGCDCPTSEEDYMGQEGVPVTFDIRVVDCEVGEEYSLRRVHGRNGEVCTFTCPCVTFTTEKVYRGQKADMMAQRCLGHKMQGTRSQVYRGSIRLLCVPIRRNTHWVMWTKRDLLTCKSVPVPHQGSLGYGWGASDSYCLPKLSWRAQIDFTLESWMQRVQAVQWQLCRITVTFMMCKSSTGGGLLHHFHALSVDL